LAEPVKARPLIEASAIPDANINLRDCICIVILHWCMIEPSRMTVPEAVAGSISAVSLWRWQIPRLASEALQPLNPFHVRDVVRKRKRFEY
jgi:hypothetical protein